MARKISELFFELRAKTEGLQKDLNDSERHLGKWSDFVAANPTAVVGAFGAALLGIAVKATLMASETDKAVRQITANLPAGTATANQLSGSIKNVAIEAGVAKSEINALANEVARLGAGNLQEFRAKLSGAQLLGDATGIDPKAAAQGIDQLADLFELDANRIVASIANIAAAARGRVDFDSAFGAFQAAAPRIRELGLSVDDATKAIVRLLDEGRSAKQVTKILNEHDADQIRAYGSAVKLSADALKELRERADEVRSSAPRTAQAIRTELSETLEQLGTRILPLVNQGLLGMKNIIDVITNAVDPKKLDAYVATLRDIGELAIAHGVKPTLNSEAGAALGQAVNELRFRELKGDFDIGTLSVEDAERVRTALSIYLKLIDENFKARHAGHEMAAADAKAEREQYAQLFTELDKVIARKKTVAATPTTGATSLGLTIDERKKLDADLLAAQKAVEQFSVSTAKAIAGGTKSGVDNALVELAQFRQAFFDARREIDKTIITLPKETPEADKKKLTDARDQLGENYEAGFRARLAEIDRIAHEQADAIRSSIEKELGELTGTLAEHGLAAIEANGRALQKQVDDASEGLKRAIVLTEDLSGAEQLRQIGAADAAKERLSNEIKVIAALERQKNLASDRTRDVDRTIQRADLAGPTAPAFKAINDEQLKQLATQRELLKTGVEIDHLTVDQVKQGAGYREIEAALLKLDKERADLLTRLIGAAKSGVDPAREALQTTIEHARAIRDAVDGALQLGEAFHLVDQSTVNVLRSITQVATQIPVLAGQIGGLGKKDDKGNAVATVGSVVGAAFPIVGGIAALASQLIGMGHAASEARQHAAELQASITKLFTGLENEIHGSSSLTARIAAAKQEYVDARNQIERDEGGKKNQTQRETDLDRLNKLEAERIAQLQQEYVIEQQQLQEDYQVRLLRAQGRDAEADAVAFAEAQHRAYNEAVKDGASEATLAALATTQAAEAFRFEAEQARKAAEATVSAGLKNIDQTATVTGEAPGQKFIDTAHFYGEQFGQPFKDLYKDLDLTTGQGIAMFNARLRAFWKGVEDGSIVLDTSVFSLDDFKDGILTLSGAATSAANALVSTGLNDINQTATVTGETPGQVLVDTAHFYGEQFGQPFKDLYKDLDLTTQEGVRQFNERLKVFWKGVEDGSIVLDTSVFSLDDFKDGILTLSGAATSAANAIATAAQIIIEAENDVTINDEILGKSTPQTIQDLAAADHIDLSRFDLTNREGAKAAENFLVGMFQGLDPNDPDYKEKRREIQNLLGRIRPLFPKESEGAPAGSSAGSSSAEHDAIANAAAGITSVQADRLSDYIATLIQVSRDGFKMLEAQLAKILTPIITGPILPPALPAWFGAPGAAPAASTTGPVGAAASGGITNIFNLRILVQVGDVDVDDAAAKRRGKIIGREAGEALNKYLGDALRSSQRNAGDTRIPTS